jgi:hypothetical protein
MDNNVRQEPDSGLDLIDRIHRRFIQDLMAEGFFSDTPPETQPDGALPEQETVR